MAKTYTPCIRGLKCFEKKGCPLAEYNKDTEEGCPAFIFMDISEINNPASKKRVGKCVDIWQHELKLRELALLEGNQQAVESFRNGMLYIDQEGRTQPRSTQASLATAFALNEISTSLQNRLEYKQQLHIDNNDATE